METVLAECVGLWLAEGDTKSRYELTFTNNSAELIQHFYSCLSKLFSEGRFRLYIYGLGESVEPPVQGVFVKNYVDKRATKPYFIIRLASKDLIKRWRFLVSTCFFLSDKNIVASILRGFFAGEGSVKVSSHNSRILRIAQRDRVPYLERWFSILGLKYHFLQKNRTYEFSGRSNWDIFSVFSIAVLHPLKNKAFLDAYHSFKQIHYPYFYLKKKVLASLSRPKSTRELAVLFSRSPARVYDVLSELKREGIVMNYQVRSINYWVRGAAVVISHKKKAYLDILKTPRPMSFLAKFFKSDYKRLSRRLMELYRLGLIPRRPDKRWKTIKTARRLSVI